MATLVTKALQAVFLLFLIYIPISLKFGTDLNGFIKSHQHNPHMISLVGSSNPISNEIEFRQGVQNQMEMNPVKTMKAIQVVHQEAQLQYLSHLNDIRTSLDKVRGREMVTRQLKAEDERKRKIRNEAMTRIQRIPEQIRSSVVRMELSASISRHVLLSEHQETLKEHETWLKEQEVIQWGTPDTNDEIDHYAHKWMQGLNITSFSESSK